MTNSEVKNCQSCKKDFTIEKEDQEFYRKIDVPAPTWCWECRFERRISWRNERSLYKRKCDATGKEIITMFAPDVDRVVYERDYWWSDKWDQLGFGMDYDFSRPFFEQYKELLAKAPLPNLANSNVVNSPYGNHNANCKNCYYTFAVYDGENVHYTGDAGELKDSMDIHACVNIEQCYDCVLCTSLANVSFSQDSDYSVGSKFLRSCMNVDDSIACVNLRKKSYHIFNKPYTKEEFQKAKKELDLGSYKNLQAFWKKFNDFIKLYPRRYAGIIKCTDVTGDNLLNSKNCKYCFDIYGDLQDCKYIVHALGARDCYDCYGVGANLELSYEATDCGVDASRNKFAVFTHECRDVDYVYSCQNSSYLFGCVGLRSKKYCILNKQYSKEEYEELLPRIKKHMEEMPYVDVKERVYKYGEFFPTEISPFAYNETIAQEYFPKSKEEIEDRGYRWRDVEKRQHGATMKAGELPDHIKDVEDSILDEIIECEHEQDCNEQCTGAFKIIPDELTFYKKHEFPLPRLCPNCRHYQRRARRNPFKLWKRQCMCDGKVYANELAHEHHGDERCSNEFETSYSPDREEIVYCKKCFETEVA